MVNDGTRAEEETRVTRRPPLSRVVAICLGLGINLTALGLLMLNRISRPLWLCLFAFSIVPYIINNLLFERGPKKA
jgi:hypothetical protein